MCVKIENVLLINNQYRFFNIAYNGKEGPKLYAIRNTTHKCQLSWDGIHKEVP